ncbi:putative Cut9 interacting protein Scn1 [Aspergillus coremiiformis]|uniref:Putative Cut9 interacting protein Scn1 n=1 Tax=Aspergillus coremiiformis TaxID=138285 RepID=A0A5N6YY62_9EURO|nr:putative Cut9 interacting protein Scn1 [Aspergillus coremiiformis]
MAQPNSENRTHFPWEIGVFDAHCHPTDTLSSIAEIPRMKATTLTVMATRGEDQDLVHQTVASLTGGQTLVLPSGQSVGRVLPCFGWHPWFSHQILDDMEKTETEVTGVTSDMKKAHYGKVLTPPPDDSFILTLPDPKPLSQLISETRQRLLTHSAALVGEVGLDRAFRLPQPWTQQEENRDSQMTPGSREGRTLSPHRVQLEHQKVVLEAQLRLAGELRRSVSVHSVQAHGVVLDLFKKLWSGHERKKPSRRERARRYSAAHAHAESDAEEEHEKLTRVVPDPPLPFPPKICMHSYSGPVEPLKQFLNPSNPSDVYFSFSTVINFNGRSPQKVVDVIKALPDDRILIESDLHTAGKQMDDLLEEVARQICEIRRWDLVQGVQQLAENWKRFVC